MLAIFPYFITIFMIILFTLFFFYNAKRLKSQNPTLSKILTILGYAGIVILIIVILPGLSLLLQNIF